MKRNSFKLFVLFCSLSFPIFAQENNGKSEIDSVYFKIAKRKIYYFGNAGISYGPEFIYGIPMLNASIQSGYQKGLYGGINFGTTLFIVGGTGFHIGYGYKNFMFEINRSYFDSPGDLKSPDYRTVIPKLGLNIGPICIKVGPDILNKSKISENFKYRFTYINKYPINFQLQYSTRLAKRKKEKKEYYNSFNR